MHGMLSAAVMLAVLTVIALVSGGSAVWLFRAAAAAPGRSRPARPPGSAASRGHEAAGVPGQPAQPGEETGGSEADYPERTWLGPARTATASLTGPAENDRWTGPGDAAGPPDASDVYDVEDWPPAEGSADGRGGPRGPGRSSPGSRGWPDTAKSLYSRGWPVMDGPPHGPDAEQPASGTNPGADAGEPDAAQEEVAEAEPPASPVGARVYILGESRRPGR